MPLLIDFGEEITLNTHELEYYGSKEITMTWIKSNLTLATNDSDEVITPLTIPSVQLRKSKKIGIDRISNETNSVHVI